MQISPNTADVTLSALAESARESESRRDTLERLANLCTDRSITVSVTFVEEEAACTVDDDMPGEAYDIQIPTRRYEQPGTDLPDAVWDKRIQVGLLFHELGHVLYSDFDRFGDRIEDVKPEWQPVFKTIYNAAEDGVVETQIANEFNVTDDLVLLDETFAHLADRRHEDFVNLFDLAPGQRAGEQDSDAQPEQAVPREYTVLEGIQLGLLDRGFTQSSRFETLIDPSAPTRTVRDDRGDVLRDLAPVLDAFMAKMLSEPDGTERVDLAWRLYQRIRRKLDPLPTLHLRNLQPGAVRPTDAAAGAFGQPARADSLPGTAAARSYVDQDATSASTGSNVRDGAAADTDRTDLPPGQIAQRELRQRARQATRSSHRQAARTRSPIQAAAVELRELTRNPSLGVDRVGIADVAEDGGDHDRWRAAVEQANQLQADLATRLHRRRKTRFESGHRSGKLDGSRIHRAARGDTRVFQRRTAGDDRDYSCMIVLDRSGSMVGDAIDAAEQAVAQFLSAFSALDVEIGLLSLYESLPYLEVPMGGAPENHVGRFMRSETGGATPLSDALVTARNFVSQGRKTVPIVIVVTDGYPDDRDAYRRELEKYSFPVYGVYIGTESRGHHQYFDNVVTTDVDSIAQKLRELARSLFRSRR